MTASPKVTLCIPAYRRVGMLLEAVESVRRQTFTDWELLVIHDGRSDEIRAAVAALGEPRLRYLENEEALGVPENWNRCIRESRGELVQILPDDDVLSPHFLERTVAVFATHPGIGFVQTGGYNCDAALRPMIRFTLPIPPGIRSGTEALRFQFEVNHCPPATLLFRKNALLAVGLWREDYFIDDTAAIFKTAWRSGFYYLPEALSGVRAHGRNYSTRLGSAGTDGIGAMIAQTMDVFGSCQPLDAEGLALFRDRMQALGNRSAKSAIGKALRGNPGAAWAEAKRSFSLHPMSFPSLGFFAPWWRQRAGARQQRIEKSGSRIADQPFHLWDGKPGPRGKA